jgi:hypothetical protein
MNSSAANRHHVPHNLSESSCVLAVEPDAKQARILEHALKGRFNGRLVMVKSTEAALEALVGAIPDVVLVSPLLPARTEDRFMQHLRALGVDASHLQLLSIPRFGDSQPAAQKKNAFNSLGLKEQSGSAAATTDPVASAFADEVASYLSQLSESRNSGEGISFPAPMQASHGIRLEHIEQLLDRLSPDDDPIEQSFKNVLAEDASDDAIREVMAPLPGFLVLDPQISPGLRSILDEADACVRLAFLTGGGACVVRALDLLLSEQGIVETDRPRQLRELSRKHPAIAESFLKLLLPVMNDTTAIWDAPRLTLGIALLKAIAYEIYVLAPERAERTAYVLGLADRYKPGIRGGSAA